MRLLAFIALGAASLSACAPSSEIAGSSPAQQTARVSNCFRIDEVRNFAADRRSDLYLRAGHDKVFKLEPSAGCSDLDTAFELAIAPRFTSSGTACVGDSVDLVVPTATPENRRCRAFVSKALTDAEIAALPPRSRP